MSDDRSKSRLRTRNPGSARAACTTFASCAKKDDRGQDGERHAVAQACLRIGGARVVGVRVGADLTEGNESEADPEGAGSCSLRLLGKLASSPALRVSRRALGQGLEGGGGCI